MGCIARISFGQEQLNGNSYTHEGCLLMGSRIKNHFVNCKHLIAEGVITHHYKHKYSDCNHQILTLIYDTLKHSHAHQPNGCRTNRIMTTTNRFSFSLPSQVLIGAILGVLVGLFFGDDCKVLQPIGTIYVTLLQAVVYPYLICTLLSGLGKLTPQTAINLFKSGWIVYVALLVLTFSVITILSTTIPISTTGIAAAIPTVQPPPDLLSLLVPSNIFNALAENLVPAVVIFFTLFGVMLQHAKNKNSLFNILDTVSEACLGFWNWLVKFAPYGVFSLLAVTAGTIKYTQLKDVGEYIVLFFIGTLLLAFWLIPAIISSLVPVSYRRIMQELRSALIISFATTLSVVALPYIFNVVQKLVAEADDFPQKENKETTNELINTTLSISYPFAQLGNFFISLFILFAAVYYNQPLESSQQILLPIVSFFASIGSPSTAINAINFTSNWLHLPSDVLNLYISLTPLTRYGQVLASVMGIMFMTIILTFAYYKKLHVQFKKLAAHLIIAVIFFGGFATVFKNFIPNQAVKIYQRLGNSSLPHTLTSNVKVTMLPPFDESKDVPAYCSRRLTVPLAEKWYFARGL